jgi:hypothetical protein
VGDSAFLRGVAVGVVVVRGEGADDDFVADREAAETEVSRHDGAEVGLLVCVASGQGVGRRETELVFDVEEASWLLGVQGGADVVKRRRCLRQRQAVEQGMQCADPSAIDCTSQQNGDDRRRVFSRFHAIQRVLDSLLVEI